MGFLELLCLAVLVINASVDYRIYNYRNIEDVVRNINKEKDNKNTEDNYITNISKYENKDNKIHEIEEKVVENIVEDQNTNNRLNSRNNIDDFINKQYLGCNVTVITKSKDLISGEVIFNVPDLVILKNDTIVFINPEDIDIMY